MPDPDPVAAAIDRIVAGAQIPGRAAREDLRRELAAHFEDAGGSPDGLRAALRRFGAESSVIAPLHRLHRIDRLVAQAARLSVSVVACVVAAFLIELLISAATAPAADVRRLTPGLFRAVAMAVAVVIGLITCWEATRPPLNRSRAVAAASAYVFAWIVVSLAVPSGVALFFNAAMIVGLGCICSQPGSALVRLLLFVATFAAFLYANHLVLRVPFAPTRALAAGVVLTIVWYATTSILRTVDRAFVGYLPDPNPV